MILIPPANENEEPLSVTPDEADELADDYQEQAGLYYSRGLCIEQADCLMALARTLRRQADEERREEARLCSPCVEEYP